MTRRTYFIIRLHVCIISCFLYSFCVMVTMCVDWLDQGVTSVTAINRRVYHSCTQGNGSNTVAVKDEMWSLPSIECEELSTHWFCLIEGHSARVGTTSKVGLRKQWRNPPCSSFAIGREIMSPAVTGCIMSIRFTPFAVVTNHVISSVCVDPNRRILSFPRRGRIRIKVRTWSFIVVCFGINPIRCFPYCPSRPGEE